MNSIVYFEDLGTAPYKDVWDYQEQLLKGNLDIKAQLRNDENEGNILHANLRTMDYLLFVEHPPVYTLGKSGDPAHILISEEDRQDKAIAYYPTNRGGDITFHGPGQLVGYPILDLEHFETDIAKYLRKLEEVIILTIGEFGLKGQRSGGETGVWLDADKPGKERKICAMGVRCSRWITMHGFALNVNTDLGYFNHIIPCGIPNKKVTSLLQELGENVPMDQVKSILKSNFEQVFGVKIAPLKETI
jgi:lipoyl(octanoyl) transferase